MPVENPVLVHQVMSGPIPGQSLTHAPKSQKWETPPQFVKLDDAMNWLMDQITEPRHMKQILNLMDAGMPIEAVARTLVFTGFSEGKWTPDVAMMLLKPVMLTLIIIAKKAGITHTPIVLPSRLDKHIKNNTNMVEMVRQFKRAPREYEIPGMDEIRKLDAANGPSLNLPSFNGGNTKFDVKGFMTKPNGVA